MEINIRDNTHLISNFLDGHLLLRVYDWLLEKQTFPKKEILKQKLKLLSDTNMNLEARQVYEALFEKKKFPQSI
jgi:hypothetical protein